MWFLFIAITLYFCHSREGGNPFGISNSDSVWIPAYAGMTAKKTNGNFSGPRTQLVN
jgi:hypothetical protein